MTNYLNIVGLCFRAGKCTIGEDAILKSVRNRKAELVLLAQDIGDQTKKKLTDKCTYYQVPFLIVKEDRDTLSQAIGKSQRVAVAILDKGFAEKIQSLVG